MCNTDSIFTTQRCPSDCVARVYLLRTSLQHRDVFTTQRCPSDCVARVYLLRTSLQHRDVFTTQRCPSDCVARVYLLITSSPLVGLTLTIRGTSAIYICSSKASSKGQLTVGRTFVVYNTLVVYNTGNFGGGVLSFVPVVGLLVRLLLYLLFWYKSTVTSTTITELLSWDSWCV